MSLAEVWSAAGITPAAVVGIGGGEIAAACAAGVLSRADGALLAAERGRLLAEHKPEHKPEHESEHEPVAVRDERFHAPAT